MSTEKSIPELIEHWKLNKADWNKEGETEKEAYCDGVILGLKMAFKAPKIDGCTKLVHSLKKKAGYRFCPNCGAGI